MSFRSGAAKIGGKIIVSEGRDKTSYVHNLKDIVKAADTAFENKDKLLLIERTKLFEDALRSIESDSVTEVSTEETAITRRCKLLRVIKTINTHFVPLVTACVRFYAKNRVNTRLAHLKRNMSQNFES